MFSFRRLYITMVAGFVIQDNFVCGFNSGLIQIWPFNTLTSELLILAIFTQF